MNIQKSESGSVPLLYSSFGDILQESHLFPKEVEIKAKISEADIKVIREWLNSHAIFKGKSDQEEFYLDNPTSTFFFTAKEGFKDANDYLRIRTSNQGHTLCFKRVHRDEKGGNPYCDECEVSIDNPQLVLQLFRFLGYSDITQLKKTREKYTYGDYEIVLDYLPKIGYFIEIELKKFTDNISISLKELEIFLKDVMGVKEYKKQTHGYVSMIWNPNHDFSTK